MEISSLFRLVQITKTCNPFVTNPGNKFGSVLEILLIAYISQKTQIGGQRKFQYIQSFDDMVLLLKSVQPCVFVFLWV